VICASCRGGRHAECPETARQERHEAQEALDETELAGSPWCDCQHVQAAS
jgi:hypothetical protein